MTRIIIGFNKPYMDKETKKERLERKAIWIARATAHYDTPEIRKEASDMFDEANKE